MNRRRTLHAPGRCAPLALAMLVVAAPGATAGGLEITDAAGPADAGPERYAEALDGVSPAAGGNGFRHSVGAELITFDSAATDALVATGWQPPARFNLDDFADHGERVRTFVAIAEALGLDPAIGAEQANWGTPQENGLSELALAVGAARGAYGVAKEDLAALTRHREDAEAVLVQLRAGAAADDGAESTAATIAALVDEIAAVDRELDATQAHAAMLEIKIEHLEAAAAIALPQGNPTQLPPAGWELVNLDVNGDGAVNQGDLDAALAGMRPEVPADGESDG